jgi:pimeloyl-ACP methyl ester carboxylesterase
MEVYVEVEPNVKILVNDINPFGAKTMLFIHGWPANHNMFEYQYNQLVSTGHRCIGVDTRGFGNSDKPLNGYKYDRLADDILAIVQTLRLQDFTLVGHSTGGAIATRYMARHDGYGVNKLVLAASASPSLIQRPHFPYGQKAADIEKNFIEASDHDRPKMLRNFGDIFFYKKVSQPFSDWFFNLGLKAASWSTIAIAKTWIAETLFDDLPKIQVPTLIMHGLHDQVVPYDLGVIQHQGIKNSKLITFENSGHGLFYDERDRFNWELIQFVRQDIVDVARLNELF